jgi:hypothetical protein
MNPVDKVVLAWLLVPRKKPSTGALALALASLLGELAGDAKKLAKDALERLKARGFIELDTRLMLTEKGRKQALLSLDSDGLPKGATFDWVKRLLVLRALGLPVSEVAIKQAGTGAWLATRVLISQYKLKLGDDPKPPDVIAALAWKAVGSDETGAFALKRAVGPLLLRDARPVVEASPPSPHTAHGGSAHSAPSLANGLAGFAESVLGAAQATATGRWHGNKVFISHVWKELQRQGVAGAMTFEDFQGRLIEANRARLLELSRADLVQAMPREDVRASETTYLNASFHFVRLDDR